MSGSKITGSQAFQWFNYTFLSVAAFLCLVPIIHVFAVSLSSASAAGSGEVLLWPVDFTLSSYKFVVLKEQFLQGTWVSVQRVVLGTAINCLLTILIAYPLSKDSRSFRSRSVYAWYFVFTMLFGGGLIPYYMTVKSTGLIDSIWALILPAAVPVFNVILLLNFFRSLPKEMEESGLIDGAGHYRIMWAIYIPLAMPAIATITLFALVGHWNSWFDGIIFMNNPHNYPLQSYLQTILIKRDTSFITPEEVKSLIHVSERTSKAAQVFVATLPILVIYPFLQRYFVSGIVLGSVKE